jgi:ABC-type transporter Mla subunit MlaD
VGILRIFEPKVHAITVLNTSVEGLSAGSPVKYLGLPIGRVTRVAVRETDGYIAVYFDLTTSAMDNLAAGGRRLRGSASELAEVLKKHNPSCFINAAGLMGGTYLELTLGSPEPPALPDVNDLPPHLFYIQARPSHIGNAIQNISRIIEEFNSINIIKMADKLDQALDTANDLLKQGDLTDLFKQLNNISRDLEFSMRNMRSALSDQNLDKINRTISNIERSTASLMKTASQEELGETLRNLNAFLRETKAFLPAAAQLAEKLNASAGPAGAQLAETVTLLHNLTAQISTLVERLDDNPDALLRGNRAPAINKE